MELSHLLLYFSELMCALVCWEMLKLGMDHQTAKCRIAQGAEGAHEVGQFAPGYFTFLTVQTFPLLLTGVVIGDVFITLTRSAMLGIALVTYALTISADGALDNKRMRWWARFWIIALILGTMVWKQSPEVRGFVHDWEKWIAAASVITMLVFFFFGQLRVGLQLWRHFLGGNTTNKRLSIQFKRLLYFAPQAIFYGMVPSSADPISLPFLSFLGTFDPIFFNGVTGTLGVIFVLALAFFGKLLGAGNRTQDTMARA